MKQLHDSAAVREQYATADKLKTRMSIHEKYSTNRQGFGNWIASQIELKEGAEVLELGCGTGALWLGQGDVIVRCSRLVLSDFSAGMVETARETLKAYPKIEFRQIDIQHIPFPPKSFDAVIANMMLYHVPDLEQGLREVRRVLRDGGVFSCATYGENGMMNWICRLFHGYGVEYEGNDRFTLQNGRAKLKPFFSEVRLLRYEDSLAVTNPEDLADYLESLTDLSAFKNLTRETVVSVLRENMKNGVLHVPKEYGMFTAR